MAECTRSTISVIKEFMKTLNIVLFVDSCPRLDGHNVLNSLKMEANFALFLLCTVNIFPIIIRILVCARIMHKNGSYWRTGCSVSLSSIQ